jgi:hypothetical protein
VVVTTTTTTVTWKGVVIWVVTEGMILVVYGGWDVTIWIVVIVVMISRGVVVEGVVVVGILDVVEWRLVMEVEGWEIWAEVWKDILEDVVEVKLDVDVRSLGLDVVETLVAVEKIIMVVVIWVEVVVVEYHHQHPAMHYILQTLIYY